MKDKTGRAALAAAIIELAKAINRLAATNEKPAVYMGGGGYPPGTWTAGLGQPGGGGVGGSPGGVHPQGGGGGAHGGGMAKVIRIDTPA